MMNDDVEYSGGVEWWADCYPQWKRPAAEVPPWQKHDEVIVSCPLPEPQVFDWRHTLALGVVWCSLAILALCGVLYFCLMR